MYFGGVVLLVDRLWAGISNSVSTSIHAGSSSLLTSCTGCLSDSKYAGGGENSTEPGREREDEEAADEPDEREGDVIGERLVSDDTSFPLSSLDHNLYAVLLSILAGTKFSL